LSAADTYTRLARPDRLYKGYVFDLDGTVYLGDALLPGAKRTIETLRRNGCRIVFVSNKPVNTRQSYADKLTRLGLPTPVEDVVNSSQVLVRWLTEHAPGARVFPIAEQVLIRELEEAGLLITDVPAEIEYVIASFDRTFVYRKLQVAFDAIRAGARLIASNADAYCPVPGGGEPDAAAIIAAIEACTGCKNEFVAGKPSTSHLRRDRADCSAWRTCTAPIVRTSSRNSRTSWFRSLFSASSSRTRRASGPASPSLTSRSRTHVRTDSTP